MKQSRFRSRILLAAVVSVTVSLSACNQSQESKDSAAVDDQQSYIAKNQPIPAFKWSLEREMLIKLYEARNTSVATHTVWRSNTGMIEGDCPSLAFSLPYDTSLTNPISPKKFVSDSGISAGWFIVEQPEPNAIFASKNTSATWVTCVNKYGSLEPIYIESKVTVYPYTVNVDYGNNRVKKAGESNLQIKITQ